MLFQERQLRAAFSRIDRNQDGMTGISTSMSIVFAVDVHFTLMYGTFNVASPRISCRQNQSSWAGGRVSRTRPQDEWAGGREDDHAARSRRHAQHRFPRVLRLLPVQHWCERVVACAPVAKIHRMFCSVIPVRFCFASYWRRMSRRAENKRNAVLSRREGIASAFSIWITCGQSRWSPFSFRVLRSAPLCFVLVFVWFLWLWLWPLCWRAVLYSWVFTEALVTF